MERYEAEQQPEPSLFARRKRIERDCFELDALQQALLTQEEEQVNDQLYLAKEALDRANERVRALQAENEQLKQSNQAFAMRSDIGTNWQRLTRIHYLGNSRININRVEEPRAIAPCGIGAGSTK